MFVLLILFRPGELDPDPESKPARPDTIDLDEDEKEMLSEARARLANTQGKKAKRKARERQLEESRRLAVLQKRRELKNAGINVKVVTRKPGQMDYNADIPFEKPAAPGFYDTIEEKDQNERQREAFDPRKQQLANKRKGDQDDDAERKKRKNDKGSASAASAAAARAGQMQKIREAEQSNKRRGLNLPAPQVSESELEHVVKMGMAGEKASRMGYDDAVTQELLGDYSTIIGGTPIRTPRAAPEEDRIANEIKNIRALTETQSSLLGGDNTPLHEGSSSTGFDGIAPRRQAIVTPNPMATPFRQANGMGATPMPGGIGAGATPLRTPRDHLSLNREGEGSQLIGSTPRDIKMHEKFVREQMRSKLASLPKPKESEWEFDAPSETAEPTISEEISEEDAAERDRRNNEAREKAAKAEFKRQSQVYQRGLPRPAVLDLNALLQRASQTTGTIEGLIANEAAILIAHDSRKFPVPDAQIKGQAPKLSQLDDRLLDAARASIAAEIASAEAQQSEWQEKFDDGWSSARAKSLPGLENYEDDEQDAFQEEQRMVAAFDTVQTSLFATAERGNKLEKKLSLHYGGYQNRAKTLRSKILEAGAALPAAENELDAFRTLQISEESAVTRRLERLREAVSFVMRREREAQDLYKSRKDELDELLAGTGTVNGWH